MSSPGASNGSAPLCRFRGQPYDTADLLEMVAPEISMCSKSPEKVAIASIWRLYNRAMAAGRPRAKQVYKKPPRRSPLPIAFIIGSVPYTS
jgi:hypothetical protein